MFDLSISFIREASHIYFTNIIYYHQLLCTHFINLFTLISWAPKSLQMVTAAMKLKRRLLLGRKAMTNLDSILKSRGITLPTKVRLVKAMVFPVVLYVY